MSGARFWQIVQYTATRAGYNGYQWHFTGVGLFVRDDGAGTNQATTNNTTASTPRNGQAISNLFVGQYIFADCDAGKIITVDVGEGNKIDVLSVSYQNTVGANWAPSQVKIKWSFDGVEWVDAKVYDDNGGTSRQVITGIEQPPSDALPANYLCSRGRDRMRSKGISLGRKKLTDGNFSFLITMRDRLRTRGVSLEDAVPYIPPFGPASIGGLLAWFAADEITGKNDGDLIQTWVDLSGNNKDFEQTTEAARPAFKTGIVNGLPALLFDGADDTMLTPSISGIKTIVVVAKYTKAAFDDYDGLITAQSNDIWFIGQAGTGWYGGEGSITRYKDGTFGGAEVTNAWHVFQGEHSSPHTMVVRVGSDRGMFRGWHGYVAEIAIYDSVLDEAYRNDITGYFKAKYGIA